jgi:hypothetical protein
MEILPASLPTLEKVREEFETWRKNRKNHRAMIPQQLWDKAVALSKQYTISKVSKTLRLGYTDLKKRVVPHRSVTKTSKSEPQTFIELKGSCMAPPSECIIEMEDPKGAKMTMRLRGGFDLDVIEFGKMFWRKGS